MRIYGADTDSPLPGRRPAATLGIFDGLHLGHQTIIRQLLAAARELGQPALVITFSPHPRQALGRAAPPAIVSQETRLRLLGEAGVDAIWLLPFTPDLARKGGFAFAEEYFHRRLDASAVILGANATFGSGRDGNADTLAGWARDWNMRVTKVPPFLVDGQPVSSTAIRLAVQSGDLERAAAYLGRPFAVEGTVVHGQGRGGKYGFPTLNLDPHHELRPPAGVYLTLAVVDGVARPSLTNIGRPPTLGEIAAGMSDFLIETHLLDFHDDLYGRVAEVRFLRKMRDVLRFKGTEELIEQVNMDLAAAREWFSDRAGR